MRLRTKVTKRAGSCQAALAMAYKLVDAAQERWRRIDGDHLVPLVRAGASSGSISVQLIEEDLPG